MAKLLNVHGGGGHKLKHKQGSLPFVQANVRGCDDVERGFRDGMNVEFCFVLSSAAKTTHSVDLVVLLLVDRM